MTFDWLQTLRPRPSARPARRRKSTVGRIAPSLELLEGRLLLSNQAPYFTAPTGYHDNDIVGISTKGVLITTVEAIDPDPDDQVTYRLSSGQESPGGPLDQPAPYGRIRVDAESGEVWLDAPLGPNGPWTSEGAYTYIFNVEATDGTATTTAAVAMGVTKSDTVVRVVEPPDDAGYCFGLDFNPCETCGNSTPTTLIWCSQENPHPVVAIDVDIPSQSPPASYGVELKIGVPTVATADPDVTSGLVGDTARLVLQFDASLFETGYYDYEVVIQGKDSSGVAVGAAKTVSGRIAVVNRADSEFGNRWWLPVLDRLYIDPVDQDAGLIRGNGTADFFTKEGSNYLAEADSFETLAVAGDGRYVLTLTAGDKKYFDQTTGLLEEIVDRSGRVQTLTYGDRDGDTIADELVEFDDGFGGITTFAYTAGLLSAMTDGDGVTWNYAHNTDGTLQRAYGPTKAGTGFKAEAVFTYDDAATGNGTLLMTSHTDGVRGTTAIDYDFASRAAVEVVHPGGVVETRNPAAVQGLDEFVAASSVLGGITFAGAQTQTTFDSEGRVVSQVAPSATGIGTTTTEYVRNASGLVTELHTPNPAGGADLATKYEHNDRGYLTKITHADGTFRSYIYAANGLDLVQETDEREKVWDYEVDPVTGNRTKLTEPLVNGTRRVTRYEYYPATHASKGLLWKVIQQAGATPDANADLVTTFEYDARGNVVKTTFADGTFRSAVYDQTTNTLSSETNERGHTTSYTYDLYNRLESMTLPDPDGAGPLAAPVWQYVFCTCGHLMSVTDPLGNVTSYEYDAAGRLETVATPDPDGAGPLTSLVTENVYDTNGRLWKEIAPGNRTTVYEYDLLGNVVKITEPDPDAAGPQAAPEWEYGYDLLGRLLWVKDPTGSVSAGTITEYDYDSVGLLTSVTDPTGDVSTYGYDAGGLLTIAGGPLATGSPLAAPQTQYAYDDAGRLTSVTDPLGHETTYAYDGLGRLVSVTAPDPDGPGGPAGP
ncbi:MAG: hypothetical protein WBC44_08930, partial [Planctomycetaceae bacterium]